MSVASFSFRRNDWTRRLLTTEPLGSRDGRPVSSRETPARCSRVALAASLSPRYDLPDLTINFWYSVFVRAVKKDGATSRVFWRAYVHIGAESRSHRSPCRLGLRNAHSKSQQFTAAHSTEFKMAVIVLVSHREGVTARPRALQANSCSSNGMRACSGGRAAAGSRSATPWPIVQIDNQDPGPLRSSAAVDLTGCAAPQSVVFGTIAASPLCPSSRRRFRRPHGGPGWATGGRCGRRFLALART